MSPTRQNTRAQRNAALARSSSSTGHVINVRYWHLADIPLCTAHVRYWGQSGHAPTSRDVCFFLVYGFLSLRDPDDV
jgi:hypothetical protein